MTDHVDPFPCDECTMVLNNFASLEEHKGRVHASKRYACAECDFGSELYTEMLNHKVLKHGLFKGQNGINSPSELFLSYLVEQTADMMSDINNLKSGLAASFEHLATGIQDNFEKLSEELKTRCASTPQPAPRATSTGVHSSPPTPPSSQQPRVHAPRMKKKTRFLSKPRILYVGDSIAHNVGIKHIETKSGTRITSKKAYSSVFDKKARWPRSNLKDVTEKALKETHNDDKYEYAVLSAPTVDITNLDTSKVKPLDSIQGLKEEVKKSCKNVMETAQKTIETNQSIRKVIILEHPPRFDTKNADPLSLKPELAKYANSLYQQLWSKSAVKDKIVLGKHNLNCSEETRVTRYTGRNNRYDGVHMYSEEGKSAYTRNILSIVSSNLPLETPRLRPSTGNNAQNMNAQKAKPNEGYSVPTQNRFNVLGN